jgi:hypothetical protein
VASEVERAELVHAHDHVRVAGQHVSGAVMSPYRCRMRFLISKAGVA